MYHDHLIFDLIFVLGSLILFFHQIRLGFTKVSLILHDSFYDDDDFFPSIMIWSFVNYKAYYQPVIIPKLKQLLVQTEKLLIMMNLHFQFCFAFVLNLYFTFKFYGPFSKQFSFYGKYFPSFGQKITLFHMGELSGVAFIFLEIWKNIYLK